MAVRPIRIILYRWAGQCGPFRARVPRGEDDLTRDVILDTMDQELGDLTVELEEREWLSEWWRPLLRGGWHTPIVQVEGRVISQGQAVNRGVLAQAVVEAHAYRNPVQGTHLFGKADCPRCRRAAELLDAAGILYLAHDVVEQPGDLFELMARIRLHLPPRTPLTLPQVWLDGRHVGGAEDLERLLPLHP